MDLSFALGGRGPRNAKSRYSLPPAHPLGALELNTYPQTCEENVSRRPHITHHFVTTVANWCRTEERAVQAELVQERSERGTEGALGPVLDLEHKREAVQRGGAEEPFRSALGDPARKCLHQVRVERSWAANQRGVRAHRIGDTSVDAAEGDRDPCQRQREGDDTAAVGRRGDLVGAREAPDLRERGLLAGMPGQTVALGRPALGAAERKHSRVLARAVVLQLRALERPAFEIVLGRRRLGEETADGCELFIVGEVGCRGDRQVAVVQVLARARDRHGLDRLRGGAHERDEVRVARRCDELALLDGYCVHAVSGLDGLAAEHRYPDRLSHADETLSA